MEDDLKNELRALDKICTQDHRNIVSVLRHDLLPYSTYYYVDMELCDINLDDYIYKPWPPGLIGKSRFFRFDNLNVPIEWAILADIATGLAFIHSLGEVHRDLKPRNGNDSHLLKVLILIVVLFCLEHDTWKLADFGSTTEGTSKGRFTTVYSRGTPSYRAPELLTETPFYNSKSDIWAVGCIFYELTAKAKAFIGDIGVHIYATSPRNLSIPQSRFDWTIEQGARREDMELLIAQ